MDVRVSGHQVDMGDSLQARVKERIGALAERYFSRAIGANVTFGRGPHDHGYTCDIIAPVAQGVVLKASNAGQDARGAFDGAADKIERQLKRYVSRLRDRKSDGSAQEALQAGAEAAYTVFAPPAVAEEPVPESPVIVAEMRVDIPVASVGDAVMLMDLRNTNALMFRNLKSDEYNMVYRREDGTVGWVEPQARPAA